MAGIEGIGAITGLTGAAGVPGLNSLGQLGGQLDPSGVGGSSLSALADAYRQQVAGGSGVAGAGGVSPLDGVTGPAANSPVAQAQAARGASFASALGDGIRTVEALDATASSKAAQAATGDLKDVHDYVIAATEAQVATELTTTIRNKALEAFNDIMRMQL